MKILELFCGTKSIGKVARERGHEVVSLDFDPQFEADITCDILTLPDDYFRGQGFDMVWASPPCTTFSVASIGKHWQFNPNGFHTPKTPAAEIGLKILRKTENIILSIKPDAYFMENPRGMMRKMTKLPSEHRHTVTYCKYGDTRMKPTDIWTNARWYSRPPCNNGDPCHVSAPRGSRTGTQGIKGAKHRSVIPPALCREVVMAAELALLREEMLNDWALAELGDLL